MNKNIVNFVLFQIGWFACVLGGASSQPWAGSAVVMTIILAHILFIGRGPQEIVIIISAMAIGTVWDSFLIWQQWIAFPNGQLSEMVAPYWIILLWGLFATTLNYSLSWLKPRLIVATVLGAIAGPIAYLGGAKLGAVVFIDQTMAIIALSIGWAVLTPALLMLSDNSTFNRKLMARRI